MYSLFAFALIFGMSFKTTFILLVVGLVFAVAYIIYLSIKLKQSPLVTADTLGQKIAADAKAGATKLEGDAESIAAYLKAKL